MGRIVGLNFEVSPDAKEIERLKAYAEEHGIDIGNSNSVRGIAKKIEDAEKSKAGDKSEE